LLEGCSELSSSSEGLSLEVFLSSSVLALSNFESSDCNKAFSLITYFLTSSKESLIEEFPLSSSKKEEYSSFKSFKWPLSFFAVSGNFWSNFSANLISLRVLFRSLMESMISIFLSVKSEDSFGLASGLEGSVGDLSKNEGLKRHIYPHNVGLMYS
jgi:hypothetical protein